MQKSRNNSKRSDSSGPMKDRKPRNSSLGNPEEVVTKKRKKKNSAILRPPKYLKKTGKSKTGSFKQNWCDESFELRPSSSETDVSEIFLSDSFNSSDTSVCFNGIHSDSASRRSILNVSSSENVVEIDEEVNNSGIFDDVVNGFDSIFESSTSQNYCRVGDVDDIILGDEITSDKEETIPSNELNATLDIRFDNISQGLENNLESGEQGFKIVKDDSCFTVILKYSKLIRVFGYCNLKILFGKCNILGYNLTTESSEYKIYSPRGTALLTLKNSSPICEEEINIHTILPKFVKKSLFKNIKIRKDDSVIMFLKTRDFKMNLIEDHIAQWILPPRTLNPCIEVEPEGSWNSVCISEEWNTIVDNIHDRMKLLICGGKGVGKSTFLRYVTNCLIQKYNGVRIIDLDPGQTEFTVPGVLSVLTVTEPLLGINYTHLMKTDRSILCDINVSQDPHKYIECVESLHSFEKTVNTTTIPTLINFMGYTDDVAVHLVSSATVILKPDKIVYIKSTKKKKNFKINIREEMIPEYAKLFYPHLSSTVQTEIVRIDSKTDDNKGWSLAARQVREMCILAYFGESMDGNVDSLQHHKLPMFEVDLLNINITDRNNSKVELDVINGNIVALCTLVQEDKSIFQCFGWAIVRAVTVYTATIITPLDENTLEEVTHLVAGCLTLPPSIYMNHENVQGHIPYVMEGELIEFGQITKRSHIPKKN